MGSYSWNGAEVRSFIDWLLPHGFVTIVLACEVRTPLKIKGFMAGFVFTFLFNSKPSAFL